MKLVPASQNLGDYLACTPLVDFDHPAVAACARRLGEGRGAPLEIGRACFLFVRDEIGHSWDVQARAVPACASETLLAGSGICFAKSMLLAALLRFHGIPTAFCYQRLAFSKAPGSYCVHALNAVLLPGSEGWVRQDARGQRPNRKAEFSAEEEILPFHPSPEKGEVDYPGLYPAPRPEVVDCLRRNTDAQWMYLHDLPRQLDLTSEIF